MGGTRHKGCSLVVLLMALLLLAPAAVSAHDDSAGMAPTLNDGRKWRVGYYQGGGYGNHRASLLAIVAALTEMGWVQVDTPPDGDPEDALGVWNWLSDPSRSDHLEFPEDAFYDARWDEARRAEIRESLLRRLRETRDLDMVIAMGTWAGRDLAVDDHSVPTVVVSTSDAVRAGIVASNADSGRDHVHAHVDRRQSQPNPKPHAHVDPNRFARHVRAFHDIVGFRRLGIVYQDSDEGRSYSGIALVEKVAAERNFRVTRCRLRGEFGDEARVEPTVVGCFEHLAPAVDAIYVVSQTGVNDRTLPQLVDVAISAGVATFAQSGTPQVRKGMMLGLSRVDHGPIGRFHGEVIARILNGALPRSLEQVFEEQVTVSINLDTAARIGFTPSRSLLQEAQTFGPEAKPAHHIGPVEPLVQTQVHLHPATARGSR